MPLGSELQPSAVKSEGKRPEIWCITCGGSCPKSWEGATAEAPRDSSPALGCVNGMLSWPAGEGHFRFPELVLRVCTVLAEITAPLVSMPTVNVL